MVFADALRLYKRFHRVYTKDRGDGCNEMCNDNSVRHVVFVSRQLSHSPQVRMTVIGKGSGFGASTRGPGSCVIEITAKVDGNSVTGTLKGGRNLPRPLERNNRCIDGTLSTGPGGISGKFAGNSFTGKIPDGPLCINWRVTLSRE